MCRLFRERATTPRGDHREKENDREKFARLRVESWEFSGCKHLTRCIEEVASVLVSSGLNARERERERERGRESIVSLFFRSSLFFSFFFPFLFSIHSTFQQRRDIFTSLLSNI